MAIVNIQNGSGPVKLGLPFQHPTVETLASRKARALDALSEKRWQVETGGVTINGILIRTDEVGQAKLAGASLGFDKDPEAAVLDWEAQPGVWVTLSQEQINGLGVAVFRHVQACFSRARIVSEAIQNASTDAAMDESEGMISTGWPT